MNGQSGTKAQGGRFAVRFVNLGWNADETFATVREALDYSRRAGFSTAVSRVDGGGIVAAWDAIGGTRFYDDAERDAFYNVAAYAD